MGRFEKLREIRVSDRVTLYFNNNGFRFCLRNNRPDGLDDWQEWKDFWPMYQKDQIQTKVFEYLDGCPDHLKTSNFYQGMTFVGSN